MPYAVYNVVHKMYELTRTNEASEAIFRQSFDMRICESQSLLFSPECGPIHSILILMILTMNGSFSLNSMRLAVMFEKHQKI